MVSIKADPVKNGGVRVSAEWVSLVITLFLLFIGGVVAFTKVEGMSSENKADIERLDQTVNARLIRIEDKLDNLIVRRNGTQ